VAATSPATTVGERPATGGDHDHVRLSDPVALVQDPVEVRNAHVVDPIDRRADPRATTAASPATAASAVPAATTATVALRSGRSKSSA